LLVKVTITKNQVSIDLRGIMKFLAVKGSLKIPIKCIKNVSTEPVKWLIFTPKAGTNLPGLFMAGTFFRRRGMEFYYLKNPKKCIVLTLINHRYSKAIVEVPDKTKTAEKIHSLLT